MKTTNFNLVRYDADDNKVFDWKEPRFIQDEEGNENGFQEKYTC